MPSRDTSRSVDSAASPKAMTPKEKQDKTIDSVWARLAYLCGLPAYQHRQTGVRINPEVTERIQEAVWNVRRMKEEADELRRQALWSRFDRANRKKKP